MSNENIGWVYVLSNPRFSDLKIGYTTYPHPQQRADEISKTTGVPAKFEVMYAALLPNPYMIEQRVHVLLNKFRISQNREFFECTVLDAIVVIRTTAGQSIIQEIDNRPETVKAREDAIRKQQEEKRRQEELARQQELARIEKQRQINERNRLELVRKEELRRQQQRDAFINSTKSAISDLFSFIFGIGCLFCVVVFVYYGITISNRVKQPAHTIAKPHLGISMKNQNKWDFKVGDQLQVGDRDISFYSCPYEFCTRDSLGTIIPRFSQVVIEDYENRGLAYHNGLIYVRYNGKICDTSYKDYEEYGCWRKEYSSRHYGWVYFSTQ